LPRNLERQLTAAATATNRDRLKPISTERHSAKTETNRTKSPLQGSDFFWFRFL